MVTLASTTIRGVVTTVSTTTLEATNPTASNVAAQIVTLDPNCTVTINTTDDDAFQVLSDDTVVFKTDLAATTTKHLNVLDVLANQYPVASPVEVTEDTNTFTMSNEYYTVTLRKTMSLPGSPLTPVSSIVPATGTVQLTGGRHFPEWDATFDVYNQYTPPTLTGYTFEVVEQGPLVVKVKATYTFSHPAYDAAGQLVFPANSNGSASEIVELRSGVNAVFFEHEANCFWVSGFDIDNLDVDQLRYRGHRASSLANGYVVVSGTPEVYSPNDNDHNNKTAIKDLTGDLTFGDYTSNPYVPIWNLYIQNTGRFLIARNAGGSEGQYIAVMGGPASRAIGTAISGVKFLGSGTATELVFGAEGRTPSAEIYPHIRYPWALTIGNEPVLSGDESEVVPAPGFIQNQQINATLTKLANWSPRSPSETFSSLSLYLSASKQAALVSRMQSDSAYTASLIAKDNLAGGYTASLLNYIATPTSGEANTLYDEIIDLHNDMLTAFWFNNGYYEGAYAYWMGVLLVNRLLPRVPFLMQGSELTTEQKANLYRAMLFFGFLAADGDFVPLENYQGFNMGGANNVIQYTGQMDNLQLMLLSNPEISEYFDAANFPARLDFKAHAYISLYGSSKGSPHYTAAGTEPTLNLIQQAAVAGIADYASEEPRIALFAQFMLDTLTPEDSRFGSLRKMIALGDGSLEASAIHPQLGTIFADINPTLSKRLMDAWDSMGAPHDFFYQSTIFKIDDTLDRQSMALADAHYPDYMSVFRSGFDTADESAVWFLHGDWATDHVHNDTGAMYCYLLGKPIALSWSSLYNPHIGGSILHNGLTLVADMTWDGTGGLVPVDASVSANGIEEGSGTFDLNAITYTASSTRPSTQATFDLDASTTWTRTVTLNKEEVTWPVVVIEDTFAGTNASDEKVLSLNLMMTGAVVTPGGNVTPSTTANRATSTSKTALTSGWTTFEFTGQWGVNLILMVYNVASANYQLGRFSHTSSPAREAAEYLDAVGSSYVEMQYQFRLWSTANSKFVLVPWLASGAKPTVTTSGMDVLVDGDTVT
jgi:hypothetical protein